MNDHADALRVMTRMFAMTVLLGFVVATLACAGPTLEEQKAQIRDNKIHFEVLTVQAFLETWGKPTYTHHERMQFYTLDDGNNLPTFRVPMGETPQGWAAAMISADSTFFGYAERGELLGFVGGLLIYREQVPATEIHSIAKMWAREDLFKTRLEKPVPATPAK